MFRFPMLITKTARFSVFSKCRFTCQYCGRKPPEVVLEIDHIIPKSRGGSNRQCNLIAACFDCNRGKRDTPISAFDGLTPDLWYCCDWCPSCEIRPIGIRPRRFGFIPSTVTTIRFDYECQNGHTWSALLEFQHAKSTALEYLQQQLPVWPANPPAHVSESNDAA